MAVALREAAGHAVIMDAPPGLTDLARTRAWLLVATVVCLAPHLAFVGLSREAFPFTSSPMFALSPPAFERRLVTFSFIDAGGRAFVPTEHEEELMTRVQPRALRRALLREAWRADRPALTWPWPASLTGGPYGHRHYDTREARRARVEAFFAGIVARERARQASQIKRRQIVAVALDTTVDDGGRRHGPPSPGATKRLGVYHLDNGRFAFADEGGENGSAVPP